MTTVLHAKKREVGKRSTLTQLRKDGQLAAVLYGYQTESTPISLDYKETAKTVIKYGYTSVFTIDVDGKQVNAVLTDIQRCALKGHVKHVDFLAVNMKQEIEVDVPVVLTGTSVGVKEGGVLNQQNHTVKIKVKPSDMPDRIEVDVTDITVGHSLTLADIRETVGYEVLNDDEYVLASVTPPTELKIDDEDANLTADDVEATGEKLDPSKPGRED